MLNIIAMPVDDGGCGWYRVRQPLEMIRRFTDNDTHLVDIDHDNPIAILQALAKADIVLCRPGTNLSVTKRTYESILAEYNKETGKNLVMNAKWVLDIDDNVEIISPYSPHYEEYGTEEVFDKGLNKWLWKDGENRFNLEENRKRIAGHIQDLKTADLVTVTTEKLAMYARAYNPHVAITPNLVNFERWWKLPFKKNNQLRIGWSGGVSHYEDWHSIKKPLNNILRKTQSKMVFIGQIFNGIIDEDNKHLIESMDWVPFKGHSYRTMCANLDLAIIPLADLPFNHYKSAVKWYEFSAMKCPCVVADVYPYNAEVNNDNAWLFTPSTLEKTVLEALQSENQRSEKAEKAYNWVYNNRNSQKNINLYTEAYGSI